MVPKQKRNEPSHVYRYVRTGTDSIQTIKYPCKPNKIKLAVRNVGAGRPASLRTTTPPSPSGVPGRGRVAVDRSRPERAIVILFFSFRASASDSTGDADADARERERIETNSDGRAVSASVISGSSTARLDTATDGRTFAVLIPSLVSSLPRARVGIETHGKGASSTRFGSVGEACAFPLTRASRRIASIQKETTARDAVDTV